MSTFALFMLSNVKLVTFHLIKSTSDTYIPELCSTLQMINFYDNLLIMKYGKIMNNLTFEMKTHFKYWLRVISTATCIKIYTRMEDQYKSKLHNWGVVSIIDS